MAEAKLVSRFLCRRKITWCGRRGVQVKQVKTSFVDKRIDTPVVDFEGDFPLIFVGCDANHCPDFARVFDNNPFIWF